jgi:hypothetical protein
MVLKNSLRVLFVLVLLYASWWSFEFVNAWAGVLVFLGSLIGIGVYLENKIKKEEKNKKS